MRKLAHKLPAFELQLIRFATKEMDLRYAFVMMEHSRCKDLPVRIRRKDFNIENEGVVIGCGLGQPDEDEIANANMIFNEALKMLNAAA